MAAFLAKGGAVKRVDAASAAEVNEANRRAYRAAQRLERGETSADVTAEVSEEAFVESATQARHAGLSVSDALDCARNVVRR
jgi:hypothetical protein